MCYKFTPGYMDPENCPYHFCGGGFAALSRDGKSNVMKCYHSSDNPKDCTNHPRCANKRPLPA